MFWEKVEDTGEFCCSLTKCDGAGARHLPNSAKFCYTVKPANQDFPCPAWKIAISSLTTSALATPLYFISSQ